MMSTDVERKISCSVLRIASKEAEKYKTFGSSEGQKYKIKSLEDI
jgi:hypothetical protein